MKANEKREIRTQLRVNKAKRVELSKKADEIKKQKTELNDERTKLIAKAKELGIEFGKKKESA